MKIYFDEEFIKQLEKSDEEHEDIVPKEANRGRILN